MGKLNIFEITILNNPQAVYYAGQVIEGHITVELNAPMKMRGIYLKLNGKGYVHWTERHSTGSGKNRRTTTRHYSASEQYFDHKFACYGKPDPGMSGDNPELTAGRHVFPFKYQLPANLPSSFEGTWGYVRYSLKANIDKPWKFDHTTKKMFTVICLLDLNREPNAAQPAQGSNSKTLCCLCCESGPITANVSLDRKGYVPGECITLNAEVNNASNTEMDCSRVKITMFQIFHATSKSRTQHSNIVKVEKPPIPAGQTYYWNQEKIAVPPVPPSYLLHCNIIDIRYVLQFEVDPSGPSFDLEIPLELIIGTIPLQQVVAQLPQMAGFAAQPQPLPSPFAASAPSADAMYPNQPPTAPSAPAMPPPSYSECVFGKVNTIDEDDNEHTRGDREYAPVYPYYNWEQHQQKTFEMDTKKTPE